MIPLVTSLVLFALGVYGVLTKKDVVRIFIGVTIMLSGVTLLLVTTAGNHAAMSYSIVLFVWVVEVMEVIITIAIFLYLARHGTQDVRMLREFKW